MILKYIFHFKKNAWKQRKGKENNFAFKWLSKGDDLKQNEENKEILI